MVSLVQHSTLARHDGSKHAHTRQLGAMFLLGGPHNGFSRLPASCCECAPPNALRDGLWKPWMPIGMLVFASLAMVFLLRRAFEKYAGVKPRCSAAATSAWLSGCCSAAG